MVRHEWYTKTGADFGVDGETTTKQDIILNGTWLPAVVFESTGGVAYFHHCWSRVCTDSQDPRYRMRLAWAADDVAATGNVHWEVRATGINDDDAAPLPPLTFRKSMIDQHLVAGAHIHYVLSGELSWGAAFNRDAGVIFEIERYNDMYDTLDADAYVIGFGLGYRNRG